MNGHEASSITALEEERGEIEEDDSVFRVEIVLVKSDKVAEAKNEETLRSGRITASF